MTDTAQRRALRWHAATEQFLADVQAEIARGEYKPVPFSRLLLQTKDDVQFDWDREQEGHT